MDGSFLEAPVYRYLKCNWRSSSFSRPNCKGQVRSGGHPKGPSGHGCCSDVLPPFSISNQLLDSNSVYCAIWELNADWSRWAERWMPIGRLPQLCELPDSFARLTQLKTLDLYSNSLTELPAYLHCFTNLRRLDLADVRISASSVFQWETR